MDLHITPSQLRQLIQLADKVANREPSDVVSRWEERLSAAGTPDRLIEVAIQVGLARRRANLGLQ